MNGNIGNEKHPEIQTVVQSLGVSYTHLPPGPELLRYAPGVLVDGMPEPETIDVPMNALLLRRQIAEIRQAVEEMLWRARFGNRREGRGLEAAAADLARQILPAAGFVGLIHAGLHPQFLIERDLASEIPWEVLAEPKGGKNGGAIGGANDGAGKLSVERLLSHRVRGGSPPKPAGNVFLVIEDPTQDTCTASVDVGGVCADHLAKLKAMLKESSYRVWELKRRNATVARVKSALQNPDVVGLYFFGHGYFPENGSEGCLALADGPLLAREIEATQTDIRFVFLNACQAAAHGGPSWGLERKSNSVAEMFARGGREKAVIAPLFPVVNAHAAAAAMRFFTEALQGATLGESLRSVRRESLSRYENDAPDISWAAYRQFGDPTRLLPRGAREAATTIAGVEMPKQARVFRGEERELDFDLFAFQIRPAFFRAAKRRTLQHRRDVTLADLLAGLLRTGELTRYAMRQQNRDPDELYEALLTTAEEGAPAVETKASGAASADETSLDDSDVETNGKPENPAAKLLAELERLFGKFRVDRESQFADSAMEALSRADERAQRSSGDQRISEEDLLLACMDDLKQAPHWRIDARIDLPPAAEVRRWLDLPPERRSVDENGRLVFSILTPSALQIVEKSHQQAQQRGVTPIPNRLFLASLLDDPQGFPARCCGRRGVDAKTLANLLVASTPAAAPKTFDLTHDVCARVVLPTLARANEYRRLWKREKIDTPLLFKAYCEIASSGFADILNAPSTPTIVRLNLREVGRSIVCSEDSSPEAAASRPAAEAPPTEGAKLERARREEVDLEGLKRKFAELNLEMDADVQISLAAAAEVAALQGYSNIRSPHLFVALASYGSPQWLSELDRGPIPRDRLILKMLAVTPSQAQPSSGAAKIHLGGKVERLLDRAAASARRRGDGQVRESDLLRCLLGDRETTIVRALVAFGYEAFLNELWAHWETEDGCDKEG